ncbi:MAG: ATP-binding protein [Candidatus Lokiarchaeota archaeon]|nr:ATP-binding protein [Candidatus Lokiarchaeota archaeon]
MFSVVISLILNIILLVTTIFYYISFIQELNYRSLNLLLFIIYLISIINFVYKIYFEFFIEPPNQIYILLLSIISHLLLFTSLTILINTKIYKNQDTTKLKFPSFFKSRQGTFSIGKILNQGKKKHKFFLSMEDLEKHMFVCGSTGTGKSNFIQNFLLNFKKENKIPFLLIEFKGEYVFLQKYIKNLIIFKPGENFSINIFDSEDIDPEIHAERIFDILKSGYHFDDTIEYTSQMQKVLIEILEEVCKDKNKHNWEGFYKECDIYMEKNKREIPMINQTIISIKNRIRRLSKGPLKQIFFSESKIGINNLFNKNVIIDLSSIIRLGGEKQDALFFLNMILKYLWDRNLEKGAFNYRGIRHITIIEDAQYFAPKNKDYKNRLSSYLEDIALLQRGTGECLISIATRPQISEDILANCGVFIVFKNHMERELQSKLLNLNGNYDYYISILEKGQCLIRVNSIKRPFSLYVPLTKREYLTYDQIQKTNNFILDGGKKDIIYN